MKRTLLPSRAGDKAGYSSRLVRALRPDAPLRLLRKLAALPVGFPANAVFRLLVAGMTGLLSMTGISYGQNFSKVPVTLTLSRMPFEQALDSLGARAGLKFAYRQSMVRGIPPVSLEANAEPLGAVLERLLVPHGLSYKLVEKTMILKKKRVPLDGKALGPVTASLNPVLLRRQPAPEYSWQTSEVKGVVSDESGQPLPGVSVVLKNSSRGVATDEEGNYSFGDLPQGAVLVFSLMGFQTQELPVDNRTVLNVQLLPDIAGLDEVVVIGYGTARKSDLTGSVARIDGEDFRRQPVTQLTEMLSGTVPGFYSRQSAAPEGGGTMEIRGQNSLSAQTNPMIVLDGVIFNGSLQDINPSDIESIDILKDASSAAIFGARAAAGVILVTTKKGSHGAPTINFSTKISMSSPTKDRKPLNAEEYLQFRQDFFTEGILNSPNVSRYYYVNPGQLPSDISVDEWLDFRAGHHDDPVTEWTQRLNLFTTEQQNYLAGRTVDWYSKVMNRQALRQNYDLSVSGGSEQVRYYWSLGYLNNEGVIAGDRYGALLTRLNLDVALNDWLNVGVNGQFSNRDEGGATANLGRMYTVSPYGNFRNEDGSLTPYPHEYVLAINPMTDYYGQTRDRKVNALFASLYTNIRLPLGFNYKFSFQPRLSYLNDFLFDGPESTRGLSLPGGYASRSNEKVYEWMTDHLLTWNRSFGAHVFDVTLLYNVEEYQRWYDTQSNQNFLPNSNLGYHGLQFGDNPALSNTDERETGEAMMARLNYTLMDKYLFTLSVRRDGYSAFGQEEPYAVFPAFAFAWKLSDEPFYNPDGFMNRVKLRFSWGVNGNREIGAYSALAQLSSLKAYNGSNVVIGVQNSRLANPLLVWEKTTSLNVGADIGLLDDRINLSMDYYVGKTNDLLLNRLLPIITGFNNVTTNLGELKNQGFELSLSTTNVNGKDFSWSSGVTFSFNRNEIVSLFGDQGEYTLLGERRNGELPDFSNKWFPGYAVDAVWDYDIQGIWQEDEAEEAARYNMTPGNFKGEDVNGDGRYVDVEDKQFIGYTVPRYLVGFRNDFTWRRFTASIFLRADLGHLIPFNEALGGSLTHDRTNYNNGPLPYWTPENRNNRYPRLRPINTAFGGGIGFYEPGSFLRLQDFSISYALPPEVYSRIGLDALSVYLSGRNALTFDDYAGWDPESRMTPMPKTFTLGVDISL